MNRSGMTEEQRNIPSNKLYREIAVSIQAIANCKKTNNLDWLEKHTDLVGKLVLQHMPSGSGIDNGTKIDFDASSPDSLIFYFGYHAMNENGFYTGWYDCTCRVTPSLQHDFNLRIVIRDYRKADRDDLRDYLYEVFRDALNTDITREEIVRLSNA